MEIKQEIRITDEESKDSDKVFMHGNLTLRISKVIWLQIMKEVKSSANVNYPKSTRYNPKDIKTMDELENSDSPHVLSKETRQGADSPSDNGSPADTSHSDDKCKVCDGNYVSHTPLRCDKCGYYKAHSEGQ